MAGPDESAHDARAIERFAAMVGRARRALIITGAGVSADSGLPTYRGVGGLYDASTTHEGVPIEVALSGDMFAKRPELTWKYIHQIETACRGAEPNAAHRVIAQLAEVVPTLWVLTQNVDGFHRRAGSTNVIDIHGDLHRLVCSDATCAYHREVADYTALPSLPRCPQCGAVVRPAVVLFGEMLPPRCTDALSRELSAGFDLVVSVGTTSAFPYIARPVLEAAASGADTVEINPGRSEVSDAVALRLAERAAPTFAALWDVIGQGVA